MTNIERKAIRAAVRLLNGYAGEIKRGHTCADGSFPPDRMSQEARRLHTRAVRTSGQLRDIAAK
jgi:hypothetical protein